MHTFKDKEGAEWVLELSLAAAQRIEASDFSAVYPHPVKLLNKLELDSNFFTVGLTNTGLLAAMAFIMAKDQVKERGLDQEGFCSLIGATELEGMKEAVWEEIADFFPEFRILLLRLKDTYRNATKKVGEKLAATNLDGNINSVIDSMLDSLDQDLKKLSSQMTGTGKRSGTSQESLASTGDR